MSLVCKGRAVAVLSCLLLWAGCGDVYRPTIIPNPVQPPDPKNFHSVFALNQNNPAYPGTGVQLNVSGDSTAGVTKVAMGPVHATTLGSLVWVANYLSDSVSTFAPASTGGGSIGTSTNVNLLPGSKPVFVESTEIGTVYVANSGQLTDLNTNLPYYAVNVINSVMFVVTSEIRVPGTTPWALAETPNGGKLYVVNRDSNNVTVVNTVDKSINTTLAAGLSPQWAVARSDNARVYVLSHDDGLLTTINSIPPRDAVMNTLSVGAGASFLYYDSNTNRLYIPNPSNSTLGIYDANNDPPSILASIDLRQPITPGGTNSPCPQTGCSPLSVAALPDGSRAYVISYFVDSNSANCPQAPARPVEPCLVPTVTAINQLTNQVTKAIPVPFDGVHPEVAASPTGSCADPTLVRFRFSIVAAADSSRIYVSSCDAGGIASISTANDSYVTTLPAPVSAFSPPSVQITAATQSGSNTTYTYNPTTTTVLAAGMSIAVTGMSNPGNNGTFTIASLFGQQFTVVNPTGVSATGENGTGLPQPGQQPPPQNPVWIFAGP
jgi:YVTN family beta-propeller protein